MFVFLSIFRGYIQLSFIIEQCKKTYRKNCLFKTVFFPIIILIICYSSTANTGFIRGNVRYGFNTIIHLEKPIIQAGKIYFKNIHNVPFIISNKNIFHTFDFSPLFYWFHYEYSICCGIKIWLRKKAPLSIKITVP